MNNNQSHGKFKHLAIALSVVFGLTACLDSDEGPIPINQPPAPPAPPAPTNAAPVVSSSAVTAAQEGVAYSYTLTATDSDAGDTLVLASVTLPGWLTFDVTSGVLSGTPAAADVGDNAVSLSVTDGTDTVTQDFTIAVTAAPVVNTAPTFSSTAVTTGEEGTVYTYTATATDADAGDTLVLASVTLPGWLTFDVATGVLTGTPAASDVGDNAVSLSVTDGTDTVNQDFTIAVTAAPVVNTPPTFTSTGLAMGTVGTAYTYTATASDVNAGDTLSFGSVTLPAWGAFDTSTGILSGTPDMAGDYPVELTVTDGTDSVSQNFTIVVTEDSAMTVELLVFENAPVDGWVAWINEGGAIELFTDDTEHDMTTRFTLTNPSVAGFSARPGENVNGVPFDASNIVSTGSLTFELKMLAAPTAGTVDWKLKIEGSSSFVEVNLSTATEGHANPVQDVWQTYTFPLADLDAAGGLDFSDIQLFMVFPNFGDAAGADYLIDNFKIVTGGDTGGGGNEPTTTSIEDFESAIDSYTFNNFEGGVSTVVANPDASGINTSAQVVKMEKNTGATFGGSTLLDVSAFDVPADSNFTMKVWSTRSVDVLFKLEGGTAGEKTATHGGTGWEELSFDFTGVEGTGYNGITLIFDNGTAGNAEAEPALWTFYYDDIAIGTNDEVVDPGGNDPVTTSIESFESAIDSYAFNNFEGGVSTVVANPDASGINTSAQVVKMEKNTGATFGGSTLLDVSAFSVPANSSFTMKVWSTRSVDVLFKLEGGTAGEKTATHGGTGWEELSFDFAGVEGTGYNGITFIFDNGTAGNAEAEPALWTFYYDDIAIVTTEEIVDAGPGPGVTDIVDYGQVTNGGFETQDLTNWIAGDGASVVMDDMGTYHVKIVAAEAQNQNIYQDRIGEGVFTAGQALTVSFDMRGTAANGGVVSALLYTDDPSQVSKTEELLPLVLNETWTRYTFDVVTGDPIGWGVSIRLAGVCGAVAECSVEAYFDNISITAAD